jgi:hypothetical protein
VSDEQPHDNEDHAAETSRYEFSGIEERHGTVPVWLAVVYAVMFVYMVYYLITFWTDKG